MTQEQREALRNGVAEFLATWAAHGSGLTAGFEILHDAFLLVGVNEDIVTPSGCSIDALTRYLRDFGPVIGLDLLDAPNVCYRDQGTINFATRAQFAALAAEGIVDTSTHVFDLTLQRIDDIRAGKFEVLAGEAWHGKAFRLHQASTAA